MGGFTTIYRDGTGEYEEKKSRFLGFVYHVTTEDEINDILSRMRKQHWDARHVCYAYVLGPKGERSRFSDDGEPSGTAGKPILDVINGHEITNCLAVVVRYFGGVLLGTGGLVRAYHEAVNSALSDAALIEMNHGYLLKVSLDYTSYGKLTYYINKQGFTLLNTEYDAGVCVTFPVPDDKINAVKTDICDMTGGSAIMDEGDPVSYGITSEGVILG